MAKSKTPAPRNAGAEFSDMAKWAEILANSQAATQGATNRQIINDSLSATDSLASRLDNGYTASGRAALDAAMGQVPQLNALSARLEALGLTAEGDVAGTEIERQLQTQALSDLALGRSLSGEQVRESQQSARSGFAARGMATGTSSAVAEILNRDASATARQNERRSFAGNVNQAISGNRIQRLNTAGGLVNQAAGVRYNTAQLGIQGANGYIALDPYTRALSSNIPTAGIGASAGMAGNTYGQVLQYGEDANNTNFNAAWSDYINRQNMQTANKSGQMQVDAAASAGKSAQNAALIGAGGAIIGGVALAF